MATCMSAEAGTVSAAASAAAAAAAVAAALACALAQAALSSFKQQSLPLRQRVVQVGGGIENMRLQAVGVSEVFVSELIRIERGSWRIERLQQRVLMRDNVNQTLAEEVAVQQVAHADRVSSSGFIAVACADASARGADRFGLAALFEDRFFGDVIREDHVSAVADQQVVADRDIAGAELVDFSQQRLGIDDDSWSNHRDDAGPQSTNRKQRQLIGLAVELHRVAGVVASLVAYDNVVLIRQQIDDFPFCFVAPLEPDDCRG